MVDIIYWDPPFNEGGSVSVKILLVLIFVCFFKNESLGSESMLIICLFKDWASANYDLCTAHLYAL